MDIKSKAEYPAGALSNFTSYPFEIDGIQCASMEGFLQSLKTADPTEQITICAIVGKAAKHWGSEHNFFWKTIQKLWWQGRELDRHGQKYQQLLDRAYEALSQNEEFRKALLATGQEILTHSIGESDPHETILTEQEFCSRLMTIRSKLISED